MELPPSMRRTVAAARRSLPASKPASLRVLQEAAQHGIRALALSTLPRLSFFLSVVLPRRDAVDLKAALCDVDADDGRGCHGRLPRSWWVQRSHAGTPRPSAGGVHVIIRALCPWHFQPGGGPEYCRACRDDDLPCARGEAGADGGLCPYRKHALINHQEHEAWDVLLACQGQLRLAPSGHVVGIEMAAALKIGAARCYNLAVVSELLPAAEAGLVEALRADADRPIEA
jgi:hypothetical protein